MRQFFQISCVLMEIIVKFRHVTEKATLSSMNHRLIPFLNQRYRITDVLTFRRRIKSRLPFAGIIRRLPYSTRFQDKG